MGNLSAFSLLPDQVSMSKLRVLWQTVTWSSLNTLSAVANRQELFSVLLPKIHSLVMKENSDMKYRTAKPPGWQHEPREL